MSAVTLEPRRKQSTSPLAAPWIASRSLSSGGANAPTRWLAMAILHARVRQNNPTGKSALWLRASHPMRGALRTSRTRPSMMRADGMSAGSRQITKAQLAALCYDHRMTPPRSTAPWRRFGCSGSACAVKDSMHRHKRRMVMPEDKLYEDWADSGSALAFPYQRA